MNVDLIIIGTGPGGYEMAAVAAQNELSVAIFEKSELGGTCLNRGCIPTKALCRNAEVYNLMKESATFGITTSELKFDYKPVADRKNEIVAQLREGVGMKLTHPLITLVKAEAEFKDAHTIVADGEEYVAKNIVIATGSAPKGLPIPGAELAMTSDDILALETLPKSLCVIGGGVIGMEFAGVFSSFGVEVTVVEFMKEILPPFDKDVAKRLKTVLSKNGVKINTNSGVKSITKTNGGYTVTWDSKGKEQSIECEQVLMSVGRQPVLPKGLENVGMTVGRRGIEVNDNMETNVAGIYAIGDVNARCMLAHAATAQGFRALNSILGANDNMKLDIVPGAVFTVPELSMVGLTEEQCKEKEMDVVVKKGFFRANGKALAMAETEGLVKMIVDAHTRKIVGCHICGAHAADLIQEVVMAMNADVTVDALAQSIHGHPTLNEVVLNVARQF